MISIYADGSSSGKSNRPGGWCWIIVVDEKPFRMGRGGDPATTNNRMEMTAALEGLRYLKRSGLEHAAHVVELVSDSQVTLGIAIGSMEATKNVDLAQPLRALTIELRARVRWVKGHAGNAYNERCDRFAKAEKKKLESL